MDYPRLGAGRAGDFPLSGPLAGVPVRRTTPAPAPAPAPADLPRRRTRRRPVRSGTTGSSRARLHAFVGVVDVHVEHQLVAAMPGGEPFHGAAVLVQALAFQHQQRAAGLGVEQTGLDPVGRHGADAVAAAVRLQAVALLQHGVQRRVLQLRRAQPGQPGGGQPGAHIGQRRAADVAQALQAQQLAGAEERGDLGRRVGRLQAQHAGSSATPLCASC